MTDTSTESASLKDETEPAAAATRAETRRKWLTRLALVVAIGLIGFGIWYLLIGRNHVSTDNAYVAAEVAQVTPLISGQVIEVAVKDTQSVRQGDVLLRLDQANVRIAIAEAEAELAAARRRFRQAVAANGALSSQIAARSANVAQARAQQASAQAELEKAQIDLRRREALAASGAVSGEELTSASKALASARAAVAAASASIAQAESNRQSAQGDFAASSAMVAGSSEATDPGVLAAMAKLEAARLDMERTTLRAPIAGTITRRQVQLGQRVTQGQPVMTIVPITRLYVEANFKERQLRRVRPGMAAKVTADLYGSSVVYDGKVAGLAGGTGASMSIIPAQNATGNWIKVAQRLAVRIELDPAQLAAHPLRLGLSTEVDIDISGD